jgi:light-regulated signal transduction histidine kinase (bacteriophytochrome)
MYLIGWNELITNYTNKKKNKMKKRITNIDTLSALMDRLVTENIKRFFFEKDKLTAKVVHQDKVISEIKIRLNELFLEVYAGGDYNYISENRTFSSSGIVENMNELITNDIHIGESDRARLEIAMLEEKRLRKSNEGRALNKNMIDKNFKNLAK